MKNEFKKSVDKNIDYSLYSSDPEKLILIAEDYLIKNNFDVGLDILKNSINLAEKNFEGEHNINLVVFYKAYAENLIKKLLFLQNDDILNIQEEHNKEYQNKYYFECQLAYEYLNKANLILKEYLKNYDEKEPSSLNQEIIKHYLNLSDNYSSLATLEKINLNFENAIGYYKLSIFYTKKYGNAFSRNLAGLYFEIAQILLYDPFECLLSLYKSRLIMEFYLQKEINEINLDIKLNIDENDLNLESIPYNSDKIYINQEIIENKIESNKDLKNNKKINEFVDIIKNINNKIQNVILELKEFINFKKSKEKKEKGENNGENREENLQKNLNNNNFNFNKIKLINIKRSEPSNNDDDIIKMEEDYYKENFT